MVNANLFVDGGGGRYRKYFVLPYLSDEGRAPGLLVNIVLRNTMTRKFREDREMWNSSLSG